MKKQKKARALFAAIIVLFAFICANAMCASAHEMYYEGSLYNPTPIVLKWNDVSNRVAKLKMNGDNLTGNYVSYYSFAKSAWPNASARVSVSQADFTSSNVDLTTTTESYWNKRWGSQEKAKKAFGICDVTSTDGTLIVDSITAKASSKKIKYAGIYLSPYQSSFQNATHQKRTMVHEIGHALGLGHSDDNYNSTTVDSIMRITVSTFTYDTPRDHDKTDLNNKY